MLSIPKISHQFSSFQIKLLQVGGCRYIQKRGFGGVAPKQGDTSSCTLFSIWRLKSLASEAEAVGVKTELTQNIGDPGRTICAVARTWGAELIVIGRRGRSGVSELLMGSVSNYVMHHAPCTVLTVQRQTEPSLEQERASGVHMNR